MKIVLASLAEARTVQSVLSCCGQAANPNFPPQGTLKPGLRLVPHPGFSFFPNSQKERVASGIRFGRTYRDAKERSPRDTPRHTGDVGVTIRQRGHNRLRVTPPRATRNSQDSEVIAAGRAWCNGIPQVNHTGRSDESLESFLARTHCARKPPSAETKTELTQ